MSEASKDWRGRFYEDFAVGDVFKSRLGRTVTEVDNIWFTCLTLNTNQIHFNTPYSERSVSPTKTGWGRRMSVQPRLTPPACVVSVTESPSTSASEATR